MQELREFNLGLPEFPSKKTLPSLTNFLGWDRARSLDSRQCKVTYKRGGAAVAG